MKTCPFCHNSVSENSPICPHCNKPLIVNLSETPEKIQDFETYHLEPKIDETYATDLIQDDSIEREIQEINRELKKRERFGEPIGDLLLQKANYYYQLRDLDNSIKDLQTALQYFRNLEDEEKMAICHNEIGLMKEELGIFEESIFHFEMAIDLFQELEDYERSIKVYNNIANAYFIINDIEKSYEFYTKALRLAEEKATAYDVVKTSSNFIDVLFLLQDYERILKILNRNFSFFKEHQDIYGLIISLTKFGKFYYHKGSDYYSNSYENLNKALSYLEQIEDQITPIQKAKLGWESYFFLGKLNLFWRHYSEAESFLLKSLESIRIFEYGGEHLNEGKVLETLGKFYGKIDDYKAAIEYYNLSIEIYDHFGIELKKAKLKRKIAQVYLEHLNDPYEAIEYFEGALKLYKSLGYLKDSAELYSKLGDIYNNRSIENLAISNFEKARHLYKELQDDYHCNLLREKIKSIKNATGF
ncbi:MAG: Tetratricopeptide repeat protein [Promethearchaeota archaeon]|nr:MAG: Tetratricopeptide repeat protein [Candidatus Lokiarchaeota archaeon]